MSVTLFPTELKSAILDYLLEDKSQLLHCRLISKDFEILATPCALRTLNISRKKGCSAAFSSLPSDSSIFIHVKEINFRALEKKHDGLEADCIEETFSMFAHLANFPSLHTLRLYFPSEYEEGMYELYGEDMSPVRILQIQIFKTLAGLTFDRSFSLSELEIHGLLALPNEGLHISRLRSLLEPLSSLHISLVTNDGEDFEMAGEDYTAFWDVDLTQLLAMTRNLTKLTVISNTNSVGFFNKNWDTLDLPKLEYLRLKNFVFTNIAYYQQRFPWSGGGVEEFMLRHGRTIKDVDLSSCWVEIHDEDLHPRSWAMIWKNFEKGLTRLESFKFEPMPGRIRPSDFWPRFNGYVAFVIESGYVNFFDEDPVDVALDGAAFESLQRTIEGRNGLQV
ncbi:hypothetical protein CPB84DRAFT_1965847 [Gymnopilus junonius]|uniref:F-box domain-containing protein n=1 Tax=Gymnopilus junonius TaxID=109634 RepID=A0A9P5NEG3_GYMJU|nr:hypothetical protein CPB84DRAFT_1965847 [Gymnopilus junonius]